MPFQKHSDILESIQREWNIAEQDIKLAEQVCRNVITPAIKELRYAGRRLADALSAIDKNEPEDHIAYLLKEACIDCHRARHDAIDAATSKMSIHLDIAVKKLRYDAIVDAYPEFAALNRKLVSAQRSIANSRLKRENRETIYAELEQVKFPELVDEYREFQCSEPLMKKLVAKSRTSLLLSKAVAAIAMLWTIWVYIYPPGCENPITKFIHSHSATAP